MSKLLLLQEGKGWICGCGGSTGHLTSPAARTSPSLACPWDHLGSKTQPCQPHGQGRPPSSQTQHGLSAGSNNNQQVNNDQQHQRCWLFPPHKIPLHLPTTQDRRSAAIHQPLKRDRYVCQKKMISKIRMARTVAHITLSSPASSQPAQHIRLQASGTDAYS